MSMYETDPAAVTPAGWDTFYTAKTVAEKNRGLLPFRVAQLYRIAVQALIDKDLTTALGACGVMAHYVGDACQPLHASRWHDGRTPAEKGVHSDYETAMVTDQRAAIATGLDTALTTIDPLDTITGHHAAAIAVVDLMHRTIDRLPPETLIDAWVTAKHDPTRSTSDALWELVGTPTIDCVADGCRTLAMLWTSAWKEAGTRAPAANPASVDDLTRLCLDPTFAPSTYLPDHHRRLVTHDLGWLGLGRDPLAPSSGRTSGHRFLLANAARSPCLADDVGGPGVGPRGEGLPAGEVHADDRGGIRDRVPSAWWLRRDVLMAFGFRQPTPAARKTRAQAARARGTG